MIFFITTAVKTSNPLTDICLENQFASHVHCDEKREQLVETGAHTLFEAEAVGTNTPERARTCNYQTNEVFATEILYEIEYIPNKCLRYLPRKPLAHRKRLFNQYIRPAASVV
jgi:hypothetical protein